MLLQADLTLRWAHRSCCGSNRRASTTIKACILRVLKYTKIEISICQNIKFFICTVFHIFSPIRASGSGNGVYQLTNVKNVAFV